MVKRNENMAKLTSGYLFPEITRRKKEFLQRNPSVKLINLGIGNTTEPLTPHILNGLRTKVDMLGTREGYTGYGEDQGMPELRAKIANKLYAGIVKPDEVFISDGAKCDIARLQQMFGGKVSISLQDPTYPVYLDGSTIAGATGYYDKITGIMEGVSFMKCMPENDFFPDLQNQERTDLIYFCSPNNPTGAAISKKHLKDLIDFAKCNRSIIIFDAAYSQYISDPDIPASIFEIEGAREVSIEVNSFSKTAGFTGVRLGWTIVPFDLKFDDGTLVIHDWNRITSTIFNGASNIAQYGGMAALDDQGLSEIKTLIDHYMQNVAIIKNAVEQLGLKYCGGINAPYIWVQFDGRKSWDIFTEILEKCHIITVPGSGFGPAGEGFIRFSAFGRREDFVEAAGRLVKL